MAILSALILHTWLRNKSKGGFLSSKADEKVQFNGKMSEILRTKCSNRAPRNAIAVRNFYAIPNIVPYGR